MIDRGAPMDVLWLRLSRRDSDPGQTLGRIDARPHLRDIWTAAITGSAPSSSPRAASTRCATAGLDAFRAEIARLAPHFRDRVQEIASWDDVKLLTVAVNRLERWYRPGLLLIGDAAHAMSPIGGVGINLAIQDAVAAANILVPRAAPRAR